MTAGILVLVLGYVLSQFYRAFLAVLAPMLSIDTGAGADDLALSSGLWFLAFAVMQIPVGAALDRIGPRRTAAFLLALGGGGGAALFALAQGPTAIHAAMILLGIGCSPVLMATYYIFGRLYSPTVFATLAGVVIGVGSLGNLAGAWPLAWAAETFGWRETVLGLAVFTLVVALCIGLLVRDPAAVDSDGPKGSLLDLLRMPGLWLILPLLFVNYAPAAGLRGLWIGPYYEGVFAATAAQIGIVTLIMGVAMSAGNFLYGPLDRVFGTRKGVILVGNLLGAACLFGLWAAPASGFWAAAVLLAGVGLFGASFPVLVAHGRAMVPTHLLGRGITLMNLFGIGGVGVMQLLTGRVHAAGMASGGSVVAGYEALFLFFGMSVLAGCAIYAFSRDARG